MEHDFKLKISEENIEKTKIIYDEVMASKSEEDKITFEEFTYLIFEFGLLHMKIKSDLERLIELKKYVDMDSEKEEFILDYLNISLKDIEKE